MALAKPSPRPVLTLSVALDGEVADIDIDPARPVVDLIRHSLAAHGVAGEDPSKCHLAAEGRLYAPVQRVADIDAADGVMLSLLLPF